MTHKNKKKMNNVQLNTQNEAAKEVIIIWSKLIKEYKL